MKNNTQTKTIEELAYRYKKIKDYVYDMQSVLGKGNFSTVYRGRNQDKSNPQIIQTKKSLLKLSKWALSPSKNSNNYFNRKSSLPECSIIPIPSDAMKSSRVSTIVTS